MKSRTRRPRQARPDHPLRLARVKAGMSQQQVADKLKVTKAAVSSWELRRTMPLPVYAVRIRQLFPKITLDELFVFPRAAA